MQAARVVRRVGRDMRAVLGISHGRYVRAVLGISSEYESGRESGQRRGGSAARRQRRGAGTAIALLTSDVR